MNARSLVPHAGQHWPCHLVGWCTSLEGASAASTHHCTDPQQIHSIAVLSLVGSCDSQTTHQNPLAIAAQFPNLGLEQLLTWLHSLLQAVATAG